MLKTLLGRFLIILGILTLSGLLLYPTLGPKTMIVEFSKDTSQTKLDKIIKYYREDGYDVFQSQKKVSSVIEVSAKRSKAVKKDNKLKDTPISQEIPVLTFKSWRITLALANAIRIHPEVQNIIFDSTWIETTLLAKQIKLGLDLQGGMHLLLQADYDDVMGKLREDLIEEWKKENYDNKGEKPKKAGAATVEDLLVLEPNLQSEMEKKLIANWSDERKKEIEYLKKSKPERAASLKIEPLVLKLAPDKIKDAQKRVIIQAREILNKRIDKTGVSEPSIRLIGESSIEIQLPGVPNPKQAKQMIGSTGAVTYKLVDDKATQELLSKMEPLVNKPISPEEYKELCNKSLSLLGRKKNDKGMHLEVIYLFEKNEEGKYFPRAPYVFEKEVRLKGDDIDRAWVGSTEEVINAVFFRLTSLGANKFAELTGANINRRMGVIIDNQLFSNPPNIESKIAGGQAYIRGSFNKLEAETVASIINEGALPVKFSIIEERTVGPSLGVESIEAGMKAVMVAFILVVLVIIVRYKLSGFIATFGLFANFLILGALLSWLGFTLTLPGIAGLILTLGMAVDANVIIFERMKEEVVAGKSPRSAITNGFDKAFSTIFDSNLTTLLAALVLSQLGTGPIKGFAVTLTVGIISSMFTALYITRFIYDLISEKKILNKLSV